MPIPVSSNPVYAAKPSNARPTNLATAIRSQLANVARQPQVAQKSTFTSPPAPPKVQLMDMKSGGGGRAGTVIGNQK